MRLHWLQHVPFEGLGSIEPWARERGFVLSCTRLFAGEPPPAVETFDWLVVMGGPMGVGDEEDHPWLRAEKRLVERALRAERTVLGVCLGAQILAEVLGARVRRAPEREIGWFPVERTPESDASPLFGALPRRFDAFHWHGDRFEIPKGAVHLARSEACDNQAFAWGGRALGLQFHLETTPESARALIDNCPGDLAPGPCVQTAEELLAGPERFERLNALMARLLDALHLPSRAV
jgi:GMP synthase (glutamine-hydrolysing)